MSLNNIQTQHCEEADYQIWKSFKKEQKQGFVNYSKIRQEKELGKQFVSYNTFVFIMPKTKIKTLITMKTLPDLQNKPKIPATKSQNYFL